MNLFDLFYILPAIIITIIALARLNDIDRSRKSKRWWVRRIGLALVVSGMAMLIGSYFTVASPNWINIMRLCIVWGFCLSWMTTPNQPPLWKFISRYDPKPE